MANARKILFVSDFDGALITTNTDTLIFKKLQPKMESVIEAVLKRRDKNIQMLSDDNLVQLMKKLGANITRGEKSYRVCWRETKKAPKYIPNEALTTVIGKKAVLYYGPRTRIPAKEFFSAMIPDDRELEEYLGKANNAWEAYEHRFIQMQEGKTTQLGFHEFIDAIFVNLFRYSDVIYASREIAKTDVRGGIVDLFELLCSKGAEIAICSYSYIDTVQTVTRNIFSRIGYPQKGIVIANQILNNDMDRNRITSIVHTGNKWRMLDSRLKYENFEKSLDGGRYLYSFGYEDDLHSLPEMAPRFEVSILLIKDKYKNLDLEGIKAASGEIFDEKIKLEICYETRSGGTGDLVAITRRNIEIMEKDQDWPNPLL